MSSTPEEGQPDRVFVCPHCEQPALGHVHGVAVWDGWPKKAMEPLSPEAEYALIQCGTCGDVSMQVRLETGGGFDADAPRIVFPSPHQLSWEVPKPLRREFEEAQACFTAKAYEATVVMVRRVLEGTCKENDAQERTLVKSLDKLKMAGLIDATLAQWADALRVLGNEGAHYTGNQVPRDDAEDALAFAEALLDHIYVLRKRFEKFADRRARKGSKEAISKPD
jgi:Domain of unknown function (DUF4145)